MTHSMSTFLMGSLLQKEDTREALLTVPETVATDAVGNAIPKLKSSLLSAQTHARAYYLESRRVKRHADHISGLLQALQVMPSKDRPRVDGSGHWAASVDHACIDLSPVHSSRVVSRTILTQESLSA